MKNKKTNKKSNKGRINKTAIAATALALPVALVAGAACTRKKNLKKAESELWDDTAKIYNMKFSVSRRSYGQIVDLIKEELTPQMRVLEIATSTGDVARGIAGECGPVIACDYSESMIEKAKQHGTPENLMWDIQDARCLTYPDDSFDAVVIVNALNVIPSPEEVLAQADRVLKEDGVLIVPNYVRTGRTFEKMAAQTKKFLGYPTYNTWTFDGYRDFLTMNHWKVVREDLVTGVSPVAYFVAMKNL